MDCHYRTSDGEKECEFQNRIIQVPDEWQGVRIQAAIAALQGMVSSHVTIEKIVYLLKESGDDKAVGLEKTVAERAVTFADELIKQLKEK